MTGGEKEKEMKTKELKKAGREEKRKMRKKEKEDT
jgi:hypothetical protein